MGRNDFKIPTGLTRLGRRAAQTIVRTAKEEWGPNVSGGGCKAFYTPEEWAEREEVPVAGILVVVHDGGDLAPLFNLAYEAFDQADNMDNNLKEIGAWSESMTSWYTIIYEA